MDWLDVLNIYYEYPFTLLGTVVISFKDFKEKFSIFTFVSNKSELYGGLLGQIKISSYLHRILIASAALFTIHGKFEKISDLESTNS